MGWLDRLLGRREEPVASRPAASWSTADSAGQAPASSDEQALQRYRYMIQTAPPETIEQAHEEAFAKLTPQQRAQALRELAAVTPAGERAAVGDRDDPKTLARLATRAEMRQPGTMERTFGRGGMGGMGMGGMMAGTIFSSLVAGFVGSMIANQFFDSMGGFDSVGDADLGGDAMGEQVASQQPMETMGGDDFGGGDFGGDF
jgi:hypothetical protein